MINPSKEIIEMKANEKKLKEETITLKKIIMNYEEIKYNTNIILSKEFLTLNN